eukprot:COSAG01_NODE_57863_length_309_cov_1.480952_1_plen_45_part_10
MAHSIRAHTGLGRLTHRWGAVSVARSSHVQNVRFLSDDARVISAG